MNTKLFLKKNKKFICGVKAIMCILTLLVLLKNALIDGMTPYYNNRDYSIQNSVDINSNSKIAMADGISQMFFAKGNLIDKFYVMYAGNVNEDAIFNLSIIDSNSKVIFEGDYPFSDLSQSVYSQIDVDIFGLERNACYTLNIATDAKGVYLYVLPSEHSYYDTYGNYSTGGTEYEGYVSVGFQFTYQYITPGNLAFFLLRLILIIFLGCIFCLGILNFESIIAEYISNSRKEGFLYALYFSVCTSFVFNPLDNLRTDVTTFTREMGAGYLTGYDASKTISNFSRWFAIFAIAFAGYFLVTNWFLKKERTEEAEKVHNFLDKIIVLADVNLVLRCITYFYDDYRRDNIFYYASYLLATIVVFGIIYLVFHLDRKIRANTYYQILILGFLVSIPLAIINITEWENNKLLIGIQALLGLILVLTIYFIPKAADKNEKLLISKAAVIICAPIPFVTSLYIEAINIANQFEIFIAHHRRNYSLICTFIFVLFIVFLFSANKKHWKLGWWEKWSNIWMVVGVGCLSQNIALENTYTPDIFESANYSVLISSFLNFKEIPIVEHLGHHMMLNVWEGIIYAILNQDFSGAIVSPYSGYVAVPFMLLFYLFIRKIWDERMALWVTLLFPFHSYWKEFAWGILLVITVVAYVEKNSYGRACAIWLAFVWCCLSRADIGLAFGIACFVSLTIYIIVEKNWKAIKQLLLPLIGIGIAGVGGWCTLCLIKGINPVTRLIEFIKLFAATINWAPNTIGNSGNTVFSWCYVIIPFAVIIGLLYAVFDKSIRKSMGKGIWIALLMLGFSYFANYSRALARHSLNEMATGIVIWTGYLFLALLFACILKKNQFFLPTFVFFILCNTLFLTDANYNENPIADMAFARMGDFSDGWTLPRFAEEERAYEVDGSVATYWTKIKAEQDVKQRVTYSEEFKQAVEPFGYVILTLLDEDDTFLDFIYNSYIYSEYKRLDPVYAAQSPTMLSGELSQEYFIDELKSNIENIPIAFMPNDTGAYSDMDGIKLNFKYYKVAEFIYANYKPLCNYGYFSVWCLNDRYNEMVQKLQGYDVISQIDITQLTTSNCTAEDYEEKIVLNSVGDDPYAYGFENCIDLSKYRDMTIPIDIEYKTDTEGEMQLFYTLNKNETYSAVKVCTTWISGHGVAHFEIPVSEYTSLRLDIPNQSSVTIYSIRLATIATHISKMDSLVCSDSYTVENCEVEKNADGTLTLVTTSIAPKIIDIQDVLGLSAFSGKTVCLDVDYITDTAGKMQAFYTTSSTDIFNETNSVSQQIDGAGHAFFNIPISEGTRIRFDIPEESNVTIRNITVSLQDDWSFIDAGYDSQQHIYSVDRLPLYWAELDEKKAVNNSIMDETEMKDGYFIFDKLAATDRQNGNYASLKTTYYGADTLGNIEDEDEYIPAALIAGKYTNGEFTEKYRFNFTIKEGLHEYLFRISSDYYWTLNDVNAFKIECSEELSKPEINILQGD